jgi:hypothetical protein
LNCKRLYFFPFLIHCTWFLLSCNSNTSLEHQEKNDFGLNSFVTIEYSDFEYKLHTGYSDSLHRGRISHSLLIEASGLAVSRTNPDRLWAHNDKGNVNQLYLLGPNAENYGFFWVWGAVNRDWEDMCIGPGPVEGLSYIYLGDIGDNDAVYADISIYRFPEPLLSTKDSVYSGAEIGATTVNRLRFRYPDGPRDAEAMFLDPITKDIYIITKRELRSSIYMAKFPYTASEKVVQTLVKIAELPFNWVLAADMSDEGSHIAIKTDHRIYYWKREGKESVLDALKRKPLLLPYFIEPQGEAFAWTSKALGYFTLSEQSGPLKPMLYFYSVK